MSATAKTILTVLMLVSCPFLWAWAVLRLSAAFLLAYATQLMNVWSN